MDKNLTPWLVIIEADFKNRTEEYCYIVNAATSEIAIQQTEQMVTKKYSSTDFLRSNGRKYSAREARKILLRNQRTGETREKYLYSSTIGAIYIACDGYKLYYDPMKYSVIYPEKR